MSQEEARGFGITGLELRIKGHVDGVGVRSFRAPAQLGTDRGGFSVKIEFSELS